MKQITGLLITLALCSHVIAGDKAIGIEEAVRLLPGDLRTPNRYGLVVGVGQYDDSRIPKIPACTNDARQLYNVLTDPAVGMFPSRNVTLLLDENVTRNKVVDALDKLGRKANKDDLVVVFFSGHGAVDEQGRSYWVMQDSRIDSLRATALAETEITELLGGIKTTRLVTLIDACYSASTAKISKSKSLLDLKRIYPKFTGDGRVAITASKGDQLSMVISDKNHPGKGFSAFTWHLIRAMKGLGDMDKDGVVTVNELWSYVKDRTEITARQQGGNQQPQLKGQIGSKFLLTVDSKRLVANASQTRRFLETLKKLFMEDSIDSDIYKEGKKLLASSNESLNDTQQQRRQIYADLVSGELKPKYLQLALNAIQTAIQHRPETEPQGDRPSIYRKKPPENESRRDYSEGLTEFYIVKVGDTFSGISKQHYGSMEHAKQIWEYNGIINPRQLRVGQKLKIPPVDELLGTNMPTRREIPGPGDITTNSIGMKLVYIPAGEFMMGGTKKTSEKPVHNVCISKGFFMGVYEVTQAQYREIMGTNPSYFKGDNNPVEKVSWNDATEFCRKLSEKDSRVYTLPTEVQWEYACRAGSTTVFSFGNSESSFGDYAWYLSNSGYKTHPVGQKKPNEFGLYDMHGNVWEWCRDWYGDDYYSNSSGIDPQGPDTGTARVLRGGSWSNDPKGCRSAFRLRITPVNSGDHLGFRVVMLVDSQSSIGSNQILNTQEHTQSVQYLEKVYVASKSSKIFHESDCKFAMSMSDNKKLVFNSRVEAVKSGRRPCNICKP